MHIKTATGWKPLEPLYRGAGCYDYPNSRPASNDHGRQSWAIAQAKTNAFIAELQRENAELAKARITRRGHDRLV